MNGRVFVCGPITHALTGARLDEELVRFLGLIHDTLEDGGVSVDSAHRVEGWGLRSNDLPPTSIVERDFAWAKASDAVVAVLELPNQRRPWRTDGTFVELGWASALNKPVIVLSRMDTNQSSLVRGLPSVFKQIQTLSPEDVSKQPESLLELLASLLEQSPPERQKLTTAP
jgi:nucleoside 2-deoxyribosyltransferase